jgi:hypothetical protein
VWPLLLILIPILWSASGAESKKEKGEKRERGKKGGRGEEENRRAIVYDELGCGATKAWDEVKMEGTTTARWRAVAWAVKASKQGKVGKRERDKGKAGSAVVQVDNSGGGEGGLEA